MFRHADSEGSDQTGQMPSQADPRLRWVHRSFCWFCHAVPHFTFDENDLHTDNYKKPCTIIAK